MENNGMKEALNSSLLTNAKLAKAVEVLMGYHMSTQEKETISKRIGGCANLEELDGTMNLIHKELHAGFVDPETGEKWSPQFVEDIKSYYESGFPFNPLTKLSEAFGSIKDYILLQEVFIKVEDADRKAVMQEEVDEKRSVCSESIKQVEEILSEMGG